MWFGAPSHDGHPARAPAILIGTMRELLRRWRRQDPRNARRAVIVYAAAWLIAVAAAVGLVSALVRGDGDRTVKVPPVLETELARAASRSRCELRQASAGEQLNPPVDGPAGGRPAPAGFYEEPIAADALTSAVRRGTIVIQFRNGLADERVAELKTLQAAVPTGTIVAPNATGMQFELAVIAYRRLLGCPRFTPRALDAVQLFRGRFLGYGPDSS